MASSVDSSLSSLLQVLVRTPGGRIVCTEASPHETFRELLARPSLARSLYSAETAQPLDLAPPVSSGPCYSTDQLTACVGGVCVSSWDCALSDVGVTTNALIAINAKLNGGMMAVVIPPCFLAGTALPKYALTPPLPNVLSMSPQRIAIQQRQRMKQRLGNKKTKSEFMKMIEEVRWSGAVRMC